MQRSKTKTGRLFGLLLAATVLIVVSSSGVIGQPVQGPTSVQDALQEIQATIAEGSKESYTRRFDVAFGNGSGACSAGVIAVPAGKRIVITYVSAYSFFVAPARLHAVSLASFEGIPEFLIRVPAVAVPDASGANYFGNAGQSMHEYSDSDVRVCASSIAPTNRTATINVSGYFVDQQ